MAIKSYYVLTENAAKHKRDIPATVTALQVKVNEAILNGWQPFGSMAVSITAFEAWYLQPFVKIT